LSAYTGIYRDDFYGTAQVNEEKGHLVLQLGNPRFTGDLEPWHDNTFRVTWRYHYYGKNYVTFDLDAYGKPHRLSFALAPMHYQRLESPADVASQN
jgi:hypothetical protein